MRNFAILLIVFHVLVVSSFAGGLLGTDYEVTYDDDDNRDILSRRDTPRRITIIDNTFWGISGLKDMRDRFSDAGWDATYREDTFVKELIKAAQNSDVLYIITHAGVRERDQQVGFVWRTLFGLNKNVITADVIKEMLEGKDYPALVIVCGCQTTSNDSMARAFGGAYIGFAKAINPISGATWCRRLLDKIAQGQTYREAFKNTPPITSNANWEGGRPKLIEPRPRDEDEY